MCFVCRPSLTQPLNSQPFCRRCRYELPRAPEGSIGLFRYSPFMRHLIHNVKIKGCQLDLKILGELFRRCLCEVEPSNWINCVAASPSVWSRFRGRLDLGEHLAREASGVFDAPFSKPPLRTRWRFSKQSFRHRYTESYGVAKFGQADESILLVDDVFTSGRTLGRLAQAYPDSIAGCLALAQARI